MRLAMAPSCNLWQQPPLLGHNGAIGNLAGCMLGAGLQPPCLSCDAGTPSQCPFVNFGPLESLLECQERAAAMPASALRGSSGAAKFCRTVTWVHPAGTDNSYSKLCYCGTSADAEWPPSHVQPTTDTNRCLTFSAVDWGAPLLLFALPAVAFYVGVGVGVGKGRDGGGLAMSAHPHFRSWLELVALARDGVAFAVSGGRLRGDSGGGSDRLLPKTSKSSSWQPSDGGSPPSKSSGKSSKRSKGKSPKHTKQGGGGSAAGVGSGAPAPPRPLPPPRSDSPPSTTKAGDGGRWVHMPI